MLSPPCSLGGAPGPGCVWGGHSVCWTQTAPVPVSLRSLILLTVLEGGRDPHFMDEDVRLRDLAFPKSQGRWVGGVDLDPLAWPQSLFLAPALPPGGTRVPVSESALSVQG
jgi:hypothetical protein